jgi:predicted ArsR family transcriptional regulator
MGRRDDGVRVFGTLADDQRRRIYDFVAGRRTRTSRDDVAEGLGIARTLAAFHLDKLAERGLLTVTFARLTGRSGPGAGRPAKLYERSDVEVVASLPERRYELAGQVLAAAIAEPLPGEATRDSALRVARERGREAGTELRRPRRGRGARAALRAAAEAAGEIGYEPDGGRDQVLLLNCPFHAVMTAAPELVCGVNQALLEGLVEGLGAEGVDARLEPAEGRCCVVLAAARQAGG